MTGGQNYVVFWSLWPNLSSRLGKPGTGSPPPGTDHAEQQQPTEAERAPASNEAVASADATVFSSAEKAMSETFTCGVAIGNGARGSAGSPSAGEGGLLPVAVVAVTGTASGAFVVWENFECVKMVHGVHGAMMSGIHE